MAYIIQIALALPSLPLLQGFVLALVGPVSQGPSQDDMAFKASDPTTYAYSVEACILSYDVGEFEGFKKAASQITAFSAWEAKGRNFVVSSDQYS